MSFFEPQTEPPPIYRSGRLQEEQRLVAKTCSFFWRILLPHCPNFAELELSKEAKSYHENSCVRITGKKKFPHRVPGNAIMMFLYKKDHLPGENPPQAVRVIGFGIGGREDKGFPSQVIFPGE